MVAQNFFVRLSWLPFAAEHIEHLEGKLSIVNIQRAIKTLCATSCAFILLFPVHFSRMHGTVVIKYNTGLDLFKLQKPNLYKKLNASFSIFFFMRYFTPYNILRYF